MKNFQRHGLFTSTKFNGRVDEKQTQCSPRGLSNLSNVLYIFLSTVIFFPKFLCLMTDGNDWPNTKQNKRKIHPSFGQLVYIYTVGDGSHTEFVTSIRNHWNCCFENRQFRQLTKVEKKVGYPSYWWLCKLSSPGGLQSTCTTTTTSTENRTLYVFINE